jgi:large subunit ribosomal protein L10
MSALKDAKVEVVAEIKEKLQKADSFVIIGYQGMTVSQDTELRNEFRKSGVNYHVYKNRLMKIALNELGYKEYDDVLNGDTAIAFASEDVSAPAKIAFGKAKSMEKLVVKCGSLNGKYLDEENCKRLAALPSREGLISQILGLLQAPVASFARTVAAIAEKQAQ